MSDEMESRLYMAGIRWTGLVIITLMVCITAYNIVERIGPVRPHEVMMYTWPGGVPSK